MNKLFIIRHARAGWKDGRSEDFHRPLKEEGIEEAIQQSQLLKNKQVSPDLIITSPAFRALNTAIIFSETLNYSPEKIILNKNIYDAGLNTLLKIVNDINEKHKTVLLFGHNPGCSNLATHFAGKEILLPTCGISELKFNTKWKESELAIHFL